MNGINDVLEEEWITTALQDREKHSIIRNGITSKHIKPFIREVYRKRTDWVQGRLESTRYLSVYLCISQWFQQYWRRLCYCNYKLRLLSLFSLPRTSCTCPLSFPAGLDFQFWLRAFGFAYLFRFRKKSFWCGNYTPLSSCQQGITLLEQTALIVVAFPASYLIEW